MTKKILVKEFAEEKARTGPSKSTRAQQAASSAFCSERIKTEVSKVAGCLELWSFSKTSSSFSVTVADGNECMTAEGCTGDGSDKSIVSSKFVERAVFDGIEKMTKMDKSMLQVALRDADRTQSFTSSRTWTPPRTVPNLAAGSLALVGVTFLVLDADFAVKNLLVGLPVLQHLGIDTKTLLEQRRDVIDGANCSTIRSALLSSGGGEAS